MRSLRLISILAAVLIAASACSSDGGESTSTAPILTTTTTVPEPTSTVPSTSTTTSTTTAPAPSSTSTTTTTIPLAELRLRAVEVGSGFDAPVLLMADPGGGADFIVEQPGRIVRLDGEGTVALDIRPDVVYGGERGLLGLAFHPDFTTNRLAYLNYTGSSGQTVIEQFRLDGDGRFDPGTRLVILEIPQPARNHNGGMIAFGPDGYLWIGMGDGGGADDRFGQGQRADTLLGAMLRIAVGFDGVATYAIPPDNPFADGVGGAPEVWATGLRNPWRFAFDGDTVWIADVGQNRTEEVSAAPAAEGALNYGWPIMEGSDCFRGSSCSTDGLVLPVTEYGHDEGCSVTGGYVYRGDAIPELDGHYVYADYCSGLLRSHHPDLGDFDWSDTVGKPGNIAGFGIGGDGELHLVSLSGSVHRLERDS